MLGVGVAGGFSQQSVEKLTFRDQPQHPSFFEKHRQTKGVQILQLVHAALVTPLTLCLPCSKDHNQDDLRKKAGIPPPCPGEFVLSWQQHTEDVYK